MTDAMGGAIPLVYTAVAGAQGHVKSGKLKAIAVSSAQRVGSLPDVPTFIESGLPTLKDFVVESWVGLLAPAKTPLAVVARLNGDLNAVLNDAPVRERLAVLGIEPTPGTPEAFLQQMQHDLAAYGLIVKSAGIKVD
jgi:tripartite-type tricarboxylate transporter receptor subunit TctC